MARIRTIKPEFWQNEELAALSEHARLLAIALLNHADDAGYFKANGFLVRAACFPFDDDSEKVRRSLQELSSIGFIDVRSDGNAKTIGHVCKFTDHQRIDKPGVSKLEASFHALVPVNTGRSHNSTKPPGLFDDDSETTPRLEQGTGNREVEQGSGKGTGKGDGNANAKSVCMKTESRPKKLAKSRPTIGEVTAYCRERGNRVDPEAFIAFYESNGWKQSNGNSIVDWKAAVVTWEKRDSKPTQHGSRPATFAEIRTDNTQRAIKEVFGEN